MRTLASLVIALATTLAIAPSANAAMKYNLKIDGLPGESVAQDMKGSIDVKAFSWGAENPTSMGSTTSGGLTGKAKFTQLTIEKHLDLATPGLFQRLAQGTPIPAMELVGRLTGAAAGTPAQQTTLRYCFQNVFVVDQEQTGASDGDAPEETVSFVFGSVSQQYTKPLTAAGPMPGAPGSVFASWDVTNNALLKGPLKSPCAAQA